MLYESPSIIQSIKAELVAYTSDNNLSVTNGIYTSKILLGIICVFHLLGILLPAYTSSIVALSPGFIFQNFYLWTIITAALYETRILVALINITLFTFLSPSIERQRQSTLLITLLMIVNIAVNTSMLFLMISCFAITEAESCLYSIICGCTSLNAALIIAYRQHHGDRSVIPSAYAQSLKFKHLPSLIGATTTLLWAVTAGLVDGRIPAQYLLGTLYSWIYLRFYAADISITSSDGQEQQLIGDLRSEFSFSSLFPNVPQIQFIVDIISSAVYHSCKSWLFPAALKSQQLREQHQLNSESQNIIPSTSSTSTSSTSTSTTQQNISSSNADIYNFRAIDPLTETRRLLAIKKIDEKLAQLQIHKTNDDLQDDFNIDIDDHKDNNTQTTTNQESSHSLHTNGSNLKPVSTSRSSQNVNGLTPASSTTAPTSTSETNNTDDKLH